MTLDETWGRIVKRVGSVPSKENRNVLEAYLYEERERVKLSSINARIDALVPLGQRLGRRAWRTTTRNDVIRLIAEHRSRQGQHLRKSGHADRPLQASTKYQWRVAITHFMKWVLDDEHPACCRRLPFRKIDAMVEKAKHLQLRPTDVKRLLAGARCARDRALIGTMVECNWRASEAAALRFDRTEARNHGYWFELDPTEPDLKTGPRERPVPVIAAKPLLDVWLEEHPRRHDPKGYWFVTLSKRSYGNRMTGKTIAEAIARCAKRAGLHHITAHSLRHLGVTLKVRRRMNPEVIRLMSGWKKRSNMLSYYNHAGAFYEDAILEEHGLRGEEPELLDIIGSMACLLCGEKVHVADLGACRGCGVPPADGVKNTERRRREEGAVLLVAVELAMHLGWSAALGSNESLEAQAVEFLHKRYASLKGEALDFPHWCMREAALNVWA